MEKSPDNQVNNDVLDKKTRTAKLGNLSVVINQTEKPEKYGRLKRDLWDFLEKYGITEEENHIIVFRVEGEQHLVNTPIFSADNKGNIKILYPSLDEGVYTYETNSKSNPTNWLYNLRLKEPIEKDGKVIKYLFPRGAEQYPFFPKRIIEKFQQSVEINTLYIFEGEKKAFFASINGIDAIALQGIHAWRKEKGSKELHPEIVRLIEVCKVRNIIYLQDADALKITYKEDEDLANRPTQFHAAVRDLNLALEPYIKANIVKRVFFMHLKIEFLPNSKGFDDLVLNNFDQKAEIFADLQNLNQNQKYFSSINITDISDKKIKSYFGLDSVQNFYKIYEPFIQKRNFIWKKIPFTMLDGQYVCVDEIEDDEYYYVWTKELLRLQKQSENPAELRSEWIKSINTFGFITTELGYFRAVFDTGKSKKVSFEQFTNFKMKILYHVSAGSNNRRVIELVNDRNTSKSLAIDTKQLTSPQLFKEMVEGQGNFQWYGKPSDIDRLKSKLFEEERPCVQVETLGWQNDGFFAFCNGIYSKNAFSTVDDYGIVSFNQKNFFIPYGVDKNPMLFQNEKRFKYQESDIRFSDWAKLYCDAFGDVGKVVLVFTISCLFSDIIFLNQGNFPMVFLYGEGGSGKSKLASFAQYLWGNPQPALKLSEPANTAKAKIRKLAQFVNSLGVMEEFVNSLETSVIKTLTGIYDRFGYEKASMNSSYGTETVPINSGVVITGNQYPNDDPLLQRLILMDYNKTEHSAEQTESYEKLKRINETGISNILGEILPMRDYFKEQFTDCFRSQYQAFKRSTSDLRITDRMVENYSVILTTYQIFRDKLNFSFEAAELESFLRETIKSHTEKRDSGSDIQRFWDIVLHLVNKSEILNKRDFCISGNEIAIKLKEIHPQYLKAHYDTYRVSGLSISTLREKLKSWREGFLSVKDSYRPLNNTSCMLFNYSATNVDILGRLNWANNINMNDEN